MANTDFVPLDKFDQDDTYPHKSSREVVDVALPPIVVNKNTVAQMKWMNRTIRVTNAAYVKIPTTFPVGFSFKMQRATANAAGIVVDGDDVFEPSFGSGTGVTKINITNRNGWISVQKMAAGKIAVDGICEDGT